jgi:hypothetical protein
MSYVLRKRSEYGSYWYYGSFCLESDVIYALKYVTFLDAKYAIARMSEKDNSGWEIVLYKTAMTDYNLWMLHNSKLAESGNEFRVDGVWQ